MKKILTLISFFLISNLTGFADSFKDVGSTHPYFNSLSYLKEKDILNGYTDGSFKPYNKINRAELLKLLMEGSGKSTETNNLDCFKDVDPAAWYANYVCAAKEQNLVSGYENGEFRPSQNINKAEALKILAKIYSWDTSTENPAVYFYDSPGDQWFTSYVNYAKEHNYLEESSTLFKPGEEITRANISTILYKHLSSQEFGHEKYSTATEDKVLSKYTFTDNSSLLTQLNPKDIQIKLSWQNEEYDLDLHLIKPLLLINEENEKEKSNEVLNYLTPFSEDESAFINYGTQEETLYIDELIDGNYRLSVKLYSEQESMYLAQPVIQLLNQGQVIKIYRLTDKLSEEEIQSLTEENAPTIKEWNVFTISNMGDLTEFTPPI